VLRPGWGAHILGDSVDLADWAFVLKEPFDPWVEVHGSETVLRSVSFDELTSAGEVRDRAIVLIERLNGAMAIAQGARAVRFAGVIQFTPDGHLHKTMFVEPAAFKLRDVTSHAAVLSVEGKPDALIYFGRTQAWLPAGAPQEAEATDWFDVYKALECIQRRFGGEHAFLKLSWVPEAQLKLLRQTANWARHSRNNPAFPRPDPAMEYETARMMLGKLIRRAFSEAGSPS
jgi:hypothetical protein